MCDPGDPYKTGSPQRRIFHQIQPEPYFFHQKPHQDSPEHLQQASAPGIRLYRTVTEQNIEEQLNDVAGIRVICSFIDDIYIMAKLLSDQDDITVLRIKDYIQNPKGNGYRSYHMIVEIPVFFAEGKTPMRAEIQIRTIAMDFWASLEHQLRYKKDLGSNEQYKLISRELYDCACTITAVDKQMQNIKNLIEEYSELTPR